MAHGLNRYVNVALALVRHAYDSKKGEEGDSRLNRKTNPGN